jgi:chaperonin GroEL
MEFNNPSLLIKEIAAGDSARTRLMRGVNTLANSVKSTLGASGRTVGYMDAMGKPHVTKDGVTVAKSVVLEDQISNMGCEWVKEAASLTVDEAGDGTTTATVLARSLMQAAFDALENKQTTRREVIEGITSMSKLVIDFLDDMAIEVTDEKLAEVAMISTNNDPVLGKLVADAFIEAGVNGEVMMEDSNDELTTVSTEKGSQFSSGLKSNHWRTDNEKNVSELENPLILILGSPVNNLRKIQTVLELCIKKNRSLLIIGELEQQPLATLLSNKVKGVLKVNVVDLPGFGPTKEDAIQDVAFITGATVLSEALGDNLDFIVPEEVLGEASRAVTTQNKTVLQIDTEDKEELIEERIAQVKDLIAKEDNPYIVKKLEERINILAGSLSLIKVGAESKVELKEKKDRIEDAIYAVKAAIKEGIVPGGGIALLNATYEFMDNYPEVGEQVLLSAITAPFQIILENAEIVLADPVLQQLAETKGKGVNVITEEVVDMVKHGIIDPVLVTKTALKNAVSVATTIISMDTIIANRIA